MSRFCERVYRDPVDIARLERTILRLRSDARVRITRNDGSQVTGIVAEQPVLQVFEGPSGEEGSNALLSLEAAGTTKIGEIQEVWIDRIAAIDTLSQSQFDEYARIGVRPIAT